jgi:hypothetical protein
VLSCKSDFFLNPEANFCDRLGTIGYALELPQLLVLIMDGDGKHICSILCLDTLICAGADM